jgi:hypothetical protein
MKHGFEVLANYILPDIVAFETIILVGKIVLSHWFPLREKLLQIIGAGKIVKHQRGALLLCGRRK